jgi:hypothetical protein
MAVQNAPGGIRYWVIGVIAFVRKTYPPRDSNVRYNYWQECLLVPITSVFGQ